MRPRYLLPATIIILVVGIACSILWYITRETLPPEIRIAAGKQGGLYHTLATDFAKRLEERTGRPVRVVETPGSEANLALLRDGGADLAMIQTVSLTPNGIAGIAPLFPEPLHFIVRRGTEIHSPADLKGHRVALGLAGSSMRQNATTVLSHYGVPLKNIKDEGDHFGAMAQDKGIDAALVTTGWMNPILEDLLHSQDLELIGISDAEGLSLRHPWFASNTLPRGLYHGQPNEPLRTVAVTALLATRSDTSDRLVQESLAALYETDLRASFPAVFSAKAAKEYDAAVMHPSVVKYHDPSVAFKRLSQTMEIISKSKEALFGIVAAVILIWGWIRRRREQAAAAADQVQKQKLDEFIGRTLTVELEQMEV
ncbi:MAG TPA: TAXI family TRAP transporter solute-binding subunit, partial [Gemmata sp.]|nr:TAXI family TRAP transporter solute-binding subunit [Gemmata sp.]